MTSIITICSPKGGTGKTTIAQNLAVLFQKNHKSVLCVDFDPQQTLLKWAMRRQNNPNADNIKCFQSTLPYWEKSLQEAEKYDIVIFDLPPGVDEYIMNVKELCQASSLVLVPSAMTINDIDSTSPWIKTLKEIYVKSAIIMSRASPREIFFKAARAELNKTGLLCPIEIRQLADAHQFAIEGLTASDKLRSSSRGDFLAVYEFVNLQLNS